MPPWEEITYFDTPKVTVTRIVTSGDWVQIATANPQRVAITISSSAIAQITVDDTIPTTDGWTINAYSPTLCFTEAQYGPLCTMAFYGAVTTATDITVVEIILRKMPEESS
jgi:hypothetical protein